MKSRTAFAITVTALTTGCVLLSGAGDLTIDPGDGGGSGGTDTGPGTTDAPSSTNDGSSGGTDAPSTPGDSGSETGTGTDGAACVCDGFVSAYRFDTPLQLGHDAFGRNDMTVVHGTPKTSTTTPPGLTGTSLDLDGSSSVCIEAGFTFNASKDHTLCWWANPSALADQKNQFAQTCTYDTWTSNSGANYLWRINNCTASTAANLEVPNVYAVGQWTQICQTYQAATRKRSVVVNGSVAKKISVTDESAIPPSTEPWCIGAYGGEGPGGFWPGLIYLPMWFDRVLDDSDLAQISRKTCCLPK